MIKVVQKKSTITESAQTCKIIQALGLKGIRSFKIHKDNNCIRGMVNKVIHLVEYELLKAADAKSADVKTSAKKAIAKKPAVKTASTKTASTKKPAAKTASTKTAKAKVAKEPKKAVKKVAKK